MTSPQQIKAVTTNLPTPPFHSAVTLEPRIPDPPVTRRTQVLGGRWDVAFSAAVMAGLLQLPLDVLKAIVGAACAMEDSDAQAWGCLSLACRALRETLRGEGCLCLVMRMRTMLSCSLTPAAFMLCWYESAACAVGPRPVCSSLLSLEPRQRVVSGQWPLL